MAKDLVDVATYTTPINVPEGDDPRSHAAEDVEAIAQGLANRTEWLRGFVTRAILSDDAARAILTVPLRVDTSVPRDPLLHTEMGPNDAPGHATNPWKELVRAPNLTGAGLQSSSLYIGSGLAGHGLIGLVVNAQWREDHGASPGRWEQLDTSKASYFVYVTADGELHFSKKEAVGGGTNWWSTWDTSTDCMLYAPSMTALNMYTEGLQVNQLLMALGPVSTSDEYNYLPIKTRTTPIRVCNFTGPVLVDGETGFVKQEETNPSHKVSCSINLPVGASLSSLRVRHIQATSTGDRLSVMKRVNHGSGTLTVTEVAFAVANSTSGVSQKITTINSIGYTVVAGDELFLQWLIVDDGSMDALTNNEICAADVTWSESKLSYQ